ncbi:hypothetical protein JTE90_027520 [Oedothorax gibbosus]|uniref:SAM domain-containing protein n=1 Tax=Oedothorax gibbosus TaxID=931172 RepID=A0AAV6VLR5_9ARAC|nr:hypothetical protein JTE90_027520 [Oedothorax gibbosus]
MQPLRRYATAARIHKMKRKSRQHRKEDSDYRIPKNYSSTPELSYPPAGEFEVVTFFTKRSRSLSDVRHGRQLSKASREHRKKDKVVLRQHSIPESRYGASSDKPEGPTLIKQNGSDIYAETVPVNIKSGDKSSRASCPPPSYPPPPPPVGQVVKVDVGRGEYADLTTSTVGRQHKSTAIMSSFRPTDSAKLYASPDAFVTVGYKKDQVQTLPRHLTKGSGGSRSQSLPPKMPQAATNQGSTENETSSGDSAGGGGYTPFKGSSTTHRSRDNESQQDRRASGTLRKAKQKGGNYPAAVSESASPNHYPPLAQEPDFDTSEEEDTTSGMETKSGLSTFRAPENETPKPKEVVASEEVPKAKQPELNSNMTLRRKRLKSQASVDSGQLQADVEQSLNEQNLEKAKSSESSEVVHSEETGEVTILFKNENDAEKSQNKKVAPIPPPKTKDSTEIKNDVEIKKEPSAKIPRNASDKQLSQKEAIEQDNSNRSAKEPIAFTATITLKQTEVVSKETPFRIKNKELIHQHSAHELLHLKNKEEALRKEKQDATNRDKIVKSPSQGFKERLNDTLDLSNQKTTVNQNDNRNKNNSNSSQKVAPAVPKKPKAEETKCSDELIENEIIKALQAESNGDGTVSPSIDASSRSVKDNIYNFEKRSNEQTTNKADLSPRRKSDVIRITLVGSQQKGNETEKISPIPSMKTSKSCPKTFEEDVDMDVESSLTAAMLHSDAHNQVTRFSAETPTTTLASTNFNDDWRRPDVTSPVNIPQYIEAAIRKPPDTPPKNTMPRRGENYNKTQTLGRKTSERDYNYHDVEATHFSETMTLNRQSIAKSDSAKYQQMSEAMHHSGREHHQNRVPASTASPQTMLPPGYPVQYQNRSTPPISSGAYIPNANSLDMVNIPANLPLEVQQKIMAEHMANMRNRESLPPNPHQVLQQMPQSKPPGPMSAQARLLDHRHAKVAAPAPNRAAHQKPREGDDECLKLCQRVDESLQLIRLQVDSLRMAAASEPEVIPELVPPPPEFNFAPPQVPQHHPQSQPQALHIAPPPEFSDESLARQRRAQQNMITTMDAPVSRRVVPPDTMNYPYPEHIYRGYHPSMQSPQDHPHHTMHHHPQHITNNMTASPTKTMTLSRGGYPQHHAPSHQQQQVRQHESNCNTLPHPGSRMMNPQMMQQHMHRPQQQHPQQHHQQQTQQQQHLQQQQQHLQQQHLMQQQMRAAATHQGSSPRMMGGSIPPIPQHKEFRQKPLHQWNMKDVSDWLESLFLPEYKITFAEAGITGSKLANMDNNDLMGLGVKQAGHRLNMERSIKWYLK